MKYTIYDVVEILKPNSNYNIKSNEYSGLEWLDSADTKPTETEINNKISELDAAEAMKLLREERNVLLSETDWMVIRNWCCNVKCLENISSGIKRFTSEFNTNFRCKL